MAKIGDIDIPSTLWQEQGSAPATPASTKWRMYFKAAGLFHKDDAGAEVGPLAPAAAPSLTGCSLYHSTTQSISSGVDTAALFDLEDYDTSTLHDIVTNTSRITVNASGKWRFTFHIRHDTASATGTRFAYLRINGTTNVRGTLMQVAGSTAINPINVGWAELTLASGDYVEVMVNQNAGSAQNIGHATVDYSRNTFAAQFLGA